MSFIARFAFLALSLLAIFAFFEVRYDIIRRRDKGAVSVNLQPTVYFRGLHFGVTPCAPLLEPVLPCRDQ